MSKTLVLTFMADDRPGLVEKLSEAVNAHGGNWLESRMARLAEKFAGIARVEIPDGGIADFRAALAALEAEGFTVHTSEGELAARPAGTLTNLELIGPDQPGIVHDISRCLAAHDVSVEEMETNLRRAPMGGDMLFSAQARVRVPAELDAEDLRTALEALADALMVDITLRQDETG
jgi:glycine cleavage system regulatory protein